MADSTHQLILKLLRFFDSLVAVYHRFCRGCYPLGSDPLESHQMTFWSVLLAPSTLKDMRPGLNHMTAWHDRREGGWVWVGMTLLCRHILYISLAEEMFSFNVSSEMHHVNAPRVEFSPALCWHTSRCSGTERPVSLRHIVDYLTGSLGGWHLCWFGLSVCFS